MIQSVSGFEVVIFDCDGVILDSNQLKVEAFDLTLKKRNIEEDIILEFLEYHRINGGISRFEKFKVLMQRWLDNWPNETYYQGLLTDFSSLCIGLYEQCSFTTGAEELIHRLARDKKLFVASGSAEDELNLVFRKRGLSPYFTNVFGSPDTKKSILERVSQKFTSQSCLMIGDALSDLLAAKSVNMAFVAMIGYSDNPHNLEVAAKAHGYTIVENLKQLQL